MANNIALSITADVADLQVKRAIMSAELKAATKDLNTFAKEASTSGNTEALREGMLAAATAAEKAKAGIAQLNTELKAVATAAAPAVAGVEHAQHGFAALSATVSETGVRLRETVGMVGELREAMMGFGELLMAAFAIEAIKHFAEKLGEAAEKTQHLSERLGISTQQTQGLQAAATAVGIPFDALAKGMGLLDKKFETTPKLFEQLGIILPKNANQMQILEATMNRFQGLDDGPKKTALALTLMGKAGAELVPFMNRGAKGLEELGQKAERYGAGLIVATEANKDLQEWLAKSQEKGLALAESVNEGKVAFMGLTNVLTDAFGPILRSAVSGFSDMVAAITESYRAGGTAKVVFDAIGQVFSGLGEILLAIGDHFSTLFGTTSMSSKDWGAVIKFVIDEVVIAFKVVIASITLVGLACKVIFESMAASAVQWYGDTREMFQKAGLALEILGDDFKTLSKVAWDALHLNWAAVAADWDAGMRQIDNVVKARGAQIIADAQNIKNTAKALLEAAAGDKAKGDALLNTDLTKRHKSPTETGIKDAKTVKPPGDVDLEHHGKGKKAKAAPKEKDTIVSDLDAKLEAKKTAWAKEQDAQGTYQQWALQSDADFWNQALKRTDLSTKDRLAIERKYLAARQALLQEKQAAENQDAKQSAALAIESARLTGELAKMEIQDKIAAITAARSAGKISAAEEIREKAAVNQQLLDLDLIQSAALNNIRLKELQAERAILGEKPGYYKKIDDQITLLAQQQADAEILIVRRKSQAERTAAQQLAAQQRGIWNQAFQGFSQNISKMITMQQGFAATFKGIWSSMQNMLAQALNNMLRNFIVGLIAQEAAQTLSSQRTVLRDAKDAGANAYKWASSWGGPPAGAVAAAIAFTAVEAYSAEGGDANVTPGLYQLHAREMVLPEWAATPLRQSLLGGGTPSFGAPANDRGGDVHINISALDGHSVKRMIMTEKHTIAKAVNEAVRSGYQQARK